MPLISVVLTHNNDNDEDDDDDDDIFLALRKDQSKLAPFELAPLFRLMKYQLSASLQISAPTLNHWICSIEVKVESETFNTKTLRTLKKTELRFKAVLSWGRNLKNEISAPSLQVSAPLELAPFLSTQAIKQAGR